MRISSGLLKSLEQTWTQPWLRHTCHTMRGRVGDALSYSTWFDKIVVTKGWTTWDVWRLCKSLIIMKSGNRIRYISYNILITLLCINIMDRRLKGRNTRARPRTIVWMVVQVWTGKRIFNKVSAGGLITNEFNPSNFHFENPSLCLRNFMQIIYRLWDHILYAQHICLNF